MAPLPRGDRLKRGEDAGNLMLLAGIVITIAFVVTALTLSQVSSIERSAAADKVSPVVGEWRFVHDRLATNLRTAVAPETKNETLELTVFPAIAASFRNIEAEKGFDAALRLVDSDDHAKTEADLLDPLDPTRYKAWSDDGRVFFDFAKDDDQTDGKIWQNPCPDPSGPIGGCIGGVLVSVYLTDGVSRVDEIMLFAVNQ